VPRTTTKTTHTTNTPHVSESDDDDDVCYEDDDDEECTVDSSTGSRSRGSGSSSTSGSSEEDPPAPPPRSDSSDEEVARSKEDSDSEDFISDNSGDSSNRKGRCGDGIVDDDRGEECDGHGHNSLTHRCNPDCRFEARGDFWAVVVIVILVILGAYIVCWCRWRARSRFAAELARRRQLEKQQREARQR
jgi:hypothetical protein